MALKDFIEKYTQKPKSGLKQMVEKAEAVEKPVEVEQPEEDRLFHKSDAPLIKGIVTETIPSMVKPFVSKATFGIADPLLTGKQPESAIRPEKSNYAKTGENIGAFAGEIIPLLLSEGLSKATIGTLAEKFGMNNVLKKIVEAYGTGQIHGTTKAVVKGEPDAVGSGAEEGAIFAGLGAVGQVLGGLRKFFGEYAPHKLMNAYMETPLDVATKYERNNVIGGFGEDLLQNVPELAKFQTQRSAKNYAIMKLNSLQQEAKGIINTLKEKTESAMFPAMSNTVADYDVMQPAAVVEGITYKQLNKQSIPLADIKQALQEEISWYESALGKDAKEVRQLRRMQTTLFDGKPEFMNVEELDTWRRVLDSFIGKGFNKNPQSLSVALDGYMTVANKLRDIVSKQSPELAKNYHKQHLLAVVKELMNTNLAETGLASESASIFKQAAQEVMHSPLAPGMAGISRKILGKPYNKTNQATKQLIRQQITTEEDKNEK